MTPRTGIKLALLIFELVIGCIFICVSVHLFRLQHQWSRVTASVESANCTQLQNGGWSCDLTISFVRHLYGGDVTSVVANMAGVRSCDQYVKGDRLQVYYKRSNPQHVSVTVPDLCFNTILGAVNLMAGMGVLGVAWWQYTLLKI